MTNTTPRPFAVSAGSYADKGYHPIPVKPGTKEPARVGVTGHLGTDLTDDEIEEYAAAEEAYNLGIRLPAGVVGIDVDLYAEDKCAAETMEQMDRLHGPLPPTVYLSARTDGSGIRLYRVRTDDPSWPANLGPTSGVDILHRYYRYAMAAPSVHPVTGTEYVVRSTVSGEEVEMPEAAALPLLPDSWEKAIRDRSADDISDVDFDAFIDGLDGGEITPAAQTVLAALDDDLRRGGGHRHMRNATLALAFLAVDGEPGIPAAVDEAREIFTTAKGPYRARSFDRTWRGGVAYAVRNNVAAHGLAFGGDQPDGGWLPRVEVKDAASTGENHLAARIASAHLLRRFLWSEGLRWLEWDGRRWESVPEATVRDAVRQALLREHEKDTKAADDRKTRAQAAARELATEDDRKQADAAAIRQYADRTRVLRTYLGVHVVKAVMYLIQGMLRVPGEKFDSHPDLLNVGNGVVDLTTGEIQPHSPGLMLTKVTEVNYQPRAEHDDWTAALQAIPEDVRGWLQVRMGQATTGHTPEDDVLLLLSGGGSNGKSTVLSGIMRALGDHAGLLPEKVLLTSSGDHPTELTTLRGLRMAVIEELPEGRYLDIRRLKATVGTSTMTARRIGADNMTWRTTHSLFVTTNYDVRVDETDHGTWRRLALVRFPYRFGSGGLPKDAGLRPRLERGADGQHEAVLAWLVAGAVKSYAGLGDHPDKVNEDTKAWRGSTDLIDAFLEDQMMLDSDAVMRAGDLHGLFTGWAAASGHKPWGSELFYSRLRSHEWVDAGHVEKPSQVVRVRTTETLYDIGGRRAARPAGPIRAVRGLRLRADAA